MKVLAILALFALSVSASLIKEADRVNGENGWYVPQRNGTFEWLDMDEAESEMNQLSLVESRARAYTPVTFYLYTKANPTQAQTIDINANSISRSNFNAKNPTRVIIHGWFSGVIDPMRETVRDAWLSRRDCNIIFVSWAQARLSYPSSVRAVPAVGRKVASLINFLAKNRGMPFSSVHVIGHSLGAHVAGFAGKNTNQAVDTIVGLDPALPFFNYNTPARRLASNDAVYTQSIHTNGGGLGFLQPIGKGAFYVNGGKRQPGCPLDVGGTCSHIRAQFYYAEAVRNNNFPAKRCGNYLNAVANKCGNTLSGVRMGAVGNENKASGNFYVRANGSAPFGRRRK